MTTTDEKSVSSKRLRRERAPEDHPLKLVPDEMLEEAVQKTILAAREDPCLSGKLYMTDIFCTLFGSVYDVRYRNIKMRLSVTRRIHNIMKVLPYPVIVRTRYTVIWDVNECQE